MQSSTDLLGSAEAAAELHVDRSTLTRWVANGTITPVMKTPGARGAFIFRRADIDSLKSAPIRGGDAA